MMFISVGLIPDMLNMGLVPGPMGQRPRLGLLGQAPPGFMGGLGPGIPGGPPPRMQGPPGNVALKLWFYRLLSHF
jgi:hypothetical protein